MAVEGIFSTLHTTVRGLNTQLKRMEVISENIANADSGPDANGRVYHKKRVVETPQVGSRPMSFQHEMSLQIKRANPDHFTTRQAISGAVPENDPYSHVKVEEAGGEVLVSDPTNPLADKNGFVRKPDINVVEEMTNMITASRGYEANISVLQAAKQIAKLTLEI